MMIKALFYVTAQAFIFNVILPVWYLIAKIKGDI